MSGLPWVARSATPVSLESYLRDIDARLLERERQYEGRSRGEFSRFSVKTYADLPAVPDGAAGLVVAEGYWYLRIGGAWVFYGKDRPPDPDWLQVFRERFVVPADGPWNTLKWPVTYDSAASVVFNSVAGVGELSRLAGAPGTVQTYKRVGIAPVHNFRLRVLFDMPAASGDYQFNVIARSSDPPPASSGGRPAPGVVLLLSTATPQVTRLNAAGVATTLGPLSSPPIAVTTKQWFAAEFDGVDIRMKSWVFGASEPEDWQVEYVDPNPAAGDGVIWVGGRLTTLGTSPMQVFDIQVEEIKESSI